MPDVVAPEQAAFCRHDRGTSAAAAGATIAAKKGLRLHWIDGLRGLAVLTVVLQHLFGVQMFSASPALVRYLDFGVFGVVVFFCVSGFVIPYSVLGLGSRPAVRFPLARVFRLYPAYWLSLLFAVWVFHPGLSVALVNATMAQRFLHWPDVEGVYWTLQVELIFYMVFEAIIFFRCLLLRPLFPLLSVGFALLSIGMGAVRFWTGTKVPLAPPAGLTVMFLATTCFLHQYHGLFSRRRMLLLAAGIYVMLTISFELGYRQNWGYEESPSRFCFSYLLAFAAFVAFQRWGLSNAALGFVGRISYPVYLFHVPVIFLVSSLLLARWGVWVCAGFDLAAIVALSALVHYVVELPTVRWGKVVTDRLAEFGQG